MFLELRIFGGEFGVVFLGSALGVWGLGVLSLEFRDEGLRLKLQRSAGRVVGGFESIGFQTV